MRGEVGTARRNAAIAATARLWLSVVARLVAAVVLFGAAGASARAAAADAPQTCAAATKALAAGQIDFAISLFGTGPNAVTGDDCVASTLKLAAQQRQNARDEAASGEQALETGDLGPAERHFAAALAEDASNTDAQQGLSQVAKLRAPTSPPASNWDTFYANRVEPAYRILGAFAVAALVLYMLSALASRWMIGVHAQVWPARQQGWAKLLGLVLIGGAAAILPVYPMFKPFTAGDLTPWPCVLSVVGVLAAFGALWWWAYRASTRDAPGEVVWARRRFRRNWWLPLTAAAVVVGLDLLLWCTCLTGSYPRLLLTYGVLILLGVIVTATSFGQNCRLQVAATNKDGGADEASKNYLLGRLRTLGMEQSHNIDASGGSTSLSSLQSQDLSGLPSGAVVGTIAKVLFALRPDLPWRAQITLVDANRVAMSLSRNGRLAFNGVFSRSDMGLGLGPAPGPGPSAAPQNGTADASAQAAASSASVTSASPASPAMSEAVAAEVAHAQLLTGAASFILVQLSSVHPDLRDGLCGATQWQSVALQVIASSVSLSQGEDTAALLRTAANLDPDNGLARFNYIRLLDDRFKTAPYDAAVLAMYEDAMARASLTTGAKPKPGWESLYLEILYNAAAAALDRCVREPVPRSHALSHYLRQARSFIDPLVAACTALSEDWTAGPEDATAATARALAPLAGNLRDIAAVLETGEMPALVAAGAAGPRFATPTMAYNDACLNALALARVRGAGAAQLTETALGDLVFALSSGDSRKVARADTFLAALRADERFVALVAEGEEQPAGSSGGPGSKKPDPGSSAS